jgi:two-component system sensor histidine kinase/response regulator
MTTHSGEIADRNESILVVDDTPANLRLLMNILIHEHYKVRPVPTGTLALASAQASPPDLILLDINMPEMSGYEVCQRLKADERTCDIPVIFVSVKDEALDKVKAFKLGGVDYITKPFQAEEVLARVENHLKLRKLQRMLQGRNLQLEYEIRERQRAEENMQQLNSELDQRVRQRTLELEKTNKELRDVLYIASHDLKTPLRGISQLAHWLVHDYADAFDKEGTAFVKLLINRVKRLDRLINGLLEYSRVGGTPAEYVTLDLNVLVRHVIEMIAPPEHLQIIVENSLPVVVGRKRDLQCVFFHLLGNAVKFMEHSQGSIRIGSLDESSWWKFWVVDNGPGIEPRYHKKVFEIFQTLQGPESSEGIGLGLALVKKIIESNGGKVWVESEKGKGSSFYFTLPKS